jgi:hypothetical protein
MRLNSSADRCGAEPAPGVANVSSPGLDLASAIRSLMLAAGAEALTMSMLGWELSCVTGEKSFSGS